MEKKRRIVVANSGTAITVELLLRFKDDDRLYVLNINELLVIRAVLCCMLRRYLVKRC